MMSRSNSARAPKMWKISFPPLVVVSICSVSAFEADIPVLQFCDPGDEVFERPASRSSFQTTSVSPVSQVRERLGQAPRSVVGA